MRPDEYAVEDLVNTPENAKESLDGLMALLDTVENPPLARLLEAPGIAGHAIKMSAQIPPVPGYDSRSNYSNQEKMRVPREINLAAALYRLGDHEGKGETILKAYAADPRGFYANYARRELSERQR
jgi:hypothetical protein